VSAPDTPRGHRSGSGPHRGSRGAPRPRASATRDDRARNALPAAARDHAFGEQVAVAGGLFPSTSSAMREGIAYGGRTRKSAFPSCSRDILPARCPGRSGEGCSHRDRAGPDVRVMPKRCLRLSVATSRPRCSGFGRASAGECEDTRGDTGEPRATGVNLARDSSGQDRATRRRGRSSPP
jgi:hypothetical protein